MYTREDLELIEKAIADLQIGKRVTSVSYGDMHLQYATLNLADLLKLRSQIKANLEEDAASRGSVRRLIFSTSKGLR